MFNLFLNNKYGVEMALFQNCQIKYNSKKNSTLIKAALTDSYI